MKLNVGCGRARLHGYVNADIAGRADARMDARRLPVKDNSLDEILASHVLEHLGYLDSIIALSEFYRALKNDGKLIVEMPDIVEILRLGVGNDLQETLNFIYGHEDDPHKYCIPTELLKEMLSGAGFSCRRAIARAHTYMPSVRLVCKKKGNAIYDQLSRMRQASACMPESYLCRIEYERMLASWVRKFVYDDGTIIFEIAVYSTRLANEFCTFFPRFYKYKQAIEVLEKKNLQGSLLDELVQRGGMPSIVRIVEKWKLALTAAWRAGALERLPACNTKCERFSPCSVAELSEESSDLGERLMMRGDVRGAREAYERAVMLDPSNARAKENIARMRTDADHDDTSD